MVFFIGADFVFSKTMISTNPARDPNWKPKRFLFWEYMLNRYAAGAKRISLPRKTLIPLVDFIIGTKKSWLFEIFTYCVK